VKRLQDQLKLDSHNSSKPPFVRGFVGKLMASSPLVHHHNEDRLVYTYPRVQFKVIGGQVKVLGIAEGSSIVAELGEMLQGCDVMIGDEHLQISEMAVEPTFSYFGFSDEKLAYCFISPWLALNEQNYHLYLSQKLQKRTELLRRILIGNILSMAKGLGIIVSREVWGEPYVTEHEVCLKGNRMLGFLGTFSSNFFLPELAGLGKSVSRGFGTIQSTSSRVTESHDATCH
jgi:hypothetical protein